MPTKGCDESTARGIAVCSIAGRAYYEIDEFAKAKEYSLKVCGMQMPNGVTKEQSEIFKFIDLKLVEARSCNVLVVLYASGSGVRQDFTKAKEYYTKACNGKEAMACFNLGVTYHNGEGVRQNRATAKEYFGKACDLGE